MTTDEATGTELLALEEVHVRYGGVTALTDIDLSITSGRVLCLLGDNGAGKSSIVRVLTGVTRPDRGSVRFRGSVRPDWKPRVARRCGIETVFQDKALAENQKVAQNVFMGRELVGRLGFINTKEQNRQTEALLRDIGFRSQVLSVHSKVRNLSGGEREGIAIGRASLFGTSVMILDEPTTGLSLTQSKHVLQLVKTTAKRGLGVLLISHNVSDAYEVGDAFIVLDRGRILRRFTRSEITLSELVNFMESAARS